MARSAKPTNRAQRVCDQIQRDLAELIARELRDPRIGLVTLNAVEITPDYAHARVYFTVIGAEAEQSAAGLNAAAGHLHKLVFIHDGSLDRGFHMDGLIREALSGGEGND
jgi:ribosome-binding factor A